MSEFRMFQKIPRLYNGHIVVTEKIDGTNGQITIADVMEEDIDRPTEDNELIVRLTAVDAHGISVEAVRSLKVGSRNRWVGPGKLDNCAFYNWVAGNADQLATLGEGTHFGEWWGKGIQRGYGKDRKYFSLFNTGRWYDPSVPQQELTEYHEAIPRVDGLSVVPILYHGPWFGRAADPVAEALRRLEYAGSVLDPSTPAEGVMVFHEAANQYFKVPFESAHKGVR